MAKCRIYLVCIAMVGLLLLEVNSINAADDIQKKIDQTKKQLTQTKVKERSVLGKLLKTQKELDQLSTHLNRLNSKVGNTQKRIEEINSELKKAESDFEQVREEISGRHGVLNRRLVAIYKYGYQSYLEILFQAENFGEFVTRFELIGDFVHNDLGLLRTLQSQVKMISKKQQEIAAKQTELEQEKKIYTNLHDQTKVQQNRYFSRVSIQRRELASIQSDRHKLEAALDEFNRLSKSMESQIRNYQVKNRGQLGTGVMIWPVRGRVTSPFGYRNHPILKKRKFHTGIDIAASSGTPISAADDGIVIFSNLNGGYGKMVTIDHGAGISTVYGHCSVLIVSSGARVVKGQKIALVGSTGLSTGPHLHFEVRKEGIPCDPLGYL